MPTRDVQREADDVKNLRQWGCLTLCYALLGTSFCDFWVNTR